MKVEELIKQLQTLPKGIEVCIFDYRKNFSDDSGDGSSLGIYPDFKIAVMEKDDRTEESKEWAYLEFTNPDLNNDGNYIGGEQ